MTRSTTQKPKKRAPNGPHGDFLKLYDPEEWMPRICAELEKGLALITVCRSFPDGPTASKVISWTNSSERWSKLYASSREIGYRLMADDLMIIADTKHEVGPNGELVKFDPIDVAMTKYRVDTRKWMLAKMLPKIYGDRLTNVHVGPDGKPIQIAAMDFKGLSPDELTTLQTLMLKAQKGA